MTLPEQQYTPEIAYALFQAAQSDNERVHFAALSAIFTLEDPSVVGALLMRTSLDDDLMVDVFSNMYNRTRINANAYIRDFDLDNNNIGQDANFEDIYTTEDIDGDEDIDVIMRGIEPDSYIVNSPNNITPLEVE